LRTDVVALLTQLDKQMDADVTDELARITAELAPGQGATDVDQLLASMTPQSWPTTTVPRVDTDVDDPSTMGRPLPAAFYRAAAGRLRWALDGRLRITYTAATGS
jgi:hypothetical protein